MTIRTDLAIELVDDVKKNNSSLSGVECSKTENPLLEIDRVRITTAEGARLAGKPIGEYVTVNTGKLWMDERGVFKRKVYLFRDVVRELLKEKFRGGRSVLVAGLGNRNITADSIGPCATKNLIVTRHIRASSPLVFEDLGLFDLCAITPGVLGQTGIESCDIIQSVAEKIRPGAVIAIDALASRNLSRLVSTIQISDSGIQPGAGVGNVRPEITEKTLGVPVISIGVPTVVDAATLTADVTETYLGAAVDPEEIRKNLSKGDLNFFVTPKETDQIIHFMGAFIGYGINLALNEKLSFEDMLSLIG